MSVRMLAGVGLEEVAPGELISRSTAPTLANNRFEAPRAPRAEVSFMLGRV